MADIRRFIDETQTMGICVLFSFWRIISYYCSLNQCNPIPLADFCRKYIFFINDRCQILSNEDFLKVLLEDYHTSRFSGENDTPNIPAIIKNNTIATDDINNSSRDVVEFLTASVFHYYCQHMENNIRGYQHIAWLAEQMRCGLFLPVRDWSAVNVIDVPIGDNIENEILRHLDADENAFVMFFTSLNSASGHSRVLCKYNNQYYVGDPNDKRFKKLADHEEFCLKQKLPYLPFSINGGNSITECLFVSDSPIVEDTPKTGSGSSSVSGAGPSDSLDMQI